MKRWKTLLGLALIIAAAAGLYYWETAGRATVLMDQVLTAGEEIPKGTLITADMITISDVPTELRQKGALEEGALPSLLGREAARTIREKDQLTLDDFRQETMEGSKGKSIYALKPEWISMRSSSLRKGDLVDIYDKNSMGLIGSFRVAFVKDSSENEVKER